MCKCIKKSLKSVDSGQRGERKAEKVAPPGAREGLRSSLYSSAGLPVPLVFLWPRVLMGAPIRRRRECQAES